MLDPLLGRPVEAIGDGETWTSIPCCPSGRICGRGSASSSPSRSGSPFGSRRCTPRSAMNHDNIAKVSVVGVGMRSHAGVASKMFEALAHEGINIEMISTSEIKVSVVIAEKYLELAVRALHSAFELDKEPGSA